MKSKKARRARAADERQAAGSRSASKRKARALEGSRKGRGAKARKAPKRRPRVTPLTERFVEALVWAAELHAGQPRKSTSIPYVAHLMAVASLALEHGAGEDEAIAALLHDAVEDQGGDGTLREIRVRFGKGVARTVDGCTDARTSPKPPWRKRKVAYLKHLPEQSASVRLVSACDKLHNAESILRDLRQHGRSLWPRFNAKKDQLLWYYQALADVFCEVGPREIGLELNRVVAEIRVLA